MKSTSSDLSVNGSICKICDLCGVVRPELVHNCAFPTHNVFENWLVGVVDVGLSDCILPLYLQFPCISCMRICEELGCLESAGVEGTVLKCFVYEMHDVPEVTGSIPVSRFMQRVQGELFQHFPSLVIMTGLAVR